MPEIKKQFTGGKMNKDVDERLVPNGEYRDAMNIQVSTSEGSEVGTIQNILGNHGIDGQTFIPHSATCIGSIADEKNDAFYWFTTSSEARAFDALASFGSSSAQPVLGVSHITQHKNNIITPVFTDVSYVMYSMWNSLGHPTYDTASQTITIITPTVPVIVGMSLYIQDNVGGFFSTPNVVTNVQEATMGGSVITFQDPLTYLDDLMQPFSMPQLMGTTLFFSSNSITGDSKGEVLGFTKSNLITGINIIDDLLFWTDGATEPKKINITRSIKGTASTGDVNTLLINPGLGISLASNIAAREKHITVIKQAPKNVLTIEKQVAPEFGYGSLAGVTNFRKDPSNAALGNLAIGDNVDNQGMTGLFLHIDPTLPRPSVGDMLLLNPDGGGLPQYEHQVKVKLTNLLSNGQTQIQVYNTVLFEPGTYEVWRAEIASISNDTLTTSQLWNWAVEPLEEKTFKNKFPRFSYRWRYQDGEYSTFAPFTNNVFLPKSEFRYHVKDAYNLAMENAITKVILSDYDQNLPEDVVSIDILHKESNSPVVYIVDTIYDVNPSSIVNHFEVTPNQLQSALPSNQLLRAWDNVPRTALAQEVSGSRVVYGNYLQNYNLEEQVVIKANTVDRSICDVNSDKKSLKSIRNYALGVSFLDKYGRQSPVFTDKGGNIDIPIAKAQKTTQLTAKVTTGAPDWATHQKFFIKDTSNEYYNLAMDRLYDARDGNVWLSFPSSERNKIDDETFLILKKGVEGAAPIGVSNKYKVLAIENEAPLFIKRKSNPISLAREPNADPFDPNTNAEVFVDPTGYPVVGQKKIIISKTYWDSLATPLTDANDLGLYEEIELRFSSVVSTTTEAIQSSKIYKVTSYGVDPIDPNYVFSLQSPISEDDSWCTIALNTVPVDTIGVEVNRVSIKDSPEFQGRFFVKVAKDPVVSDNIVSQAINTLELEEITLSTLPFHYLADQDGFSGHNTTFDVNGQLGTTNTYLAWGSVLSPSPISAAPEGFWFIDAAYYHGTYDPVIYGGCAGAFQPSHWASEGMPQAVVPSNHPNMYGDTITTPGFNKGIEPDGSGGAYIYLSYSNLQNAQSSGSLHTNETDAASIAAVAGSITNVGPPAMYETIFRRGLQELSPWDCDNTQHWTLGQPTINSNHEDVDQHFEFGATSRFKFAGGDEVYTIIGTTKKSYHVNFTGFQESDDLYSPAHNNQFYNGYTQPQLWKDFFNEMAKFGAPRNRRITYKIHIDKDPTDPQYGFNPVDPVSGANATDLGHIFFIDEDFMNVEDQVVSEFPAIWETEPKKDVDLDIYYEVDGTYPLEINNDTSYTFAPKGSTISITRKDGSRLLANSPSGFINSHNVVVEGWVENKVILSNTIQLDEYFYSNTTDMLITFHRPDGSCVSSTIDGWDEDELSITAGYPTWPSGAFLPRNIVINANVSKQTVSLSWFNCYSFGNGVESQRVRDDYNQITIDKGAKASSTLDKLYKEEHRKYGLIYSGLYNSTAGVNNLNQFIAAEKITKDINPTYGSIQRLHSRSSADGDLIVLCEDRILKILANKDAVFNADGNPQLTATENVLGQTIPYSGEYGISKNPESFASENYRVYFADKVRGVVMRLSRDGLTPISNHGMKDWFRDNLKLSNKILGSYDGRNKEYNITLASDPTYTTTTTTTSYSWTDSVEYPLVLFGNRRFVTAIGVGGMEVGDHVEVVSSSGPFSLPPSTQVNSIIFDQSTGLHEILISSMVALNAGQPVPSWPWLMDIIITGDRHLTTTFQNPIGGEKTLSFKEDVRGWVSFKSFIQEGGVSCAGEYYTFNNGKAFMHNSPTELRNTFYGAPIDSSFTVVLNDVPGSIKSFDTINYEGSQARVTQFTGVNINNTVFNDGQYHNLSPVLGWYVDSVKTDQEIGGINEFIEKEGKWFSYMKGTEIIHYEGELNGLPSYRPVINQDGSSTFDQASFAIQGLGILDGSTIINLTGDCTDPTAMNYNPNADWDDGSCIYPIYGCMEVSAQGNSFDVTANVEDGSCVWFGCLDPGGDMLPSSVTIFGADALNYESQYPGAISNDGSCILIVYGCLDPLNSNYDPLANMDAEPGSPEACVPDVYGCTEPEGVNYYAGAAIDNGLCEMPGCIADPSASNYQYSTVTGQPFSSSALNYTPFDPTNPNGGVYDDGSCIAPGCTDGGGLNEAAWNILGYPTQSSQVYTGATASNYNPNATVDDLSCVYCGAVNANNNDYHGHADIGCRYCRLEDWAQYAISADINTNELTIVVTAESIADSADVQSIEFEIIDSASGTAPLVFTLDTNALEYDHATKTWTVVISNLALYAPINIEVRGECSHSNSQTLSFITTAFTAPVAGCSEIYACNYNVNVNIDDGSCEYYSCSGCTDATAISSSYNKQNVGPDIGMPCTGQSGCTIACGDGITNASNGTGCCVYDVAGCTDVNYDNYNPLATIDDGSCIMYVYGCTDPMYVQFDITANIDDGSCQDLIPYGCLDPDACNYLFDQFDSPSPGMEHDCQTYFLGNAAGCCVYPFTQAWMGGDQSYSPEYESTGATSNGDLALETTTHYVTGDPATDINIGWQFEHLLGNSNIESFWLNLWERNDDDTGWDFMGNYYKHGAATYLTTSGGVWTATPFKDGSASYLWSNTAADQTDPNNYAHRPYNAIGGTRKYRMRMGQRVNGIDYGYAFYHASGNQSNIAGCGVEHTWDFNLVGCMTPDIFGGAYSNPVLGCLDTLACNYDCAADVNGNPQVPPTNNWCSDGVTCHEQSLCILPPDTATCVTWVDQYNQETNSCIADICYSSPTGPYSGNSSLDAVGVCQATPIDPVTGYGNKCHA